MSYSDQQSSRPKARINSTGVIIPDSMVDEAFRGDYSGGENLIYKGFAQPGAATSSPVWQIAKLTYDGSNNLTAIQWPDANNANSLTVLSGIGSNDYIFTWDNRTSYTYV